MLYEKRLLVLGGEGTGCVRLEKTSSGINASLTASGISGYDLLIVVSDGNGLLYYAPSTLVRPYSFSMPMSFDLQKLTVCVADGEKLLLSGSLRAERVWQSNLEDDVRRARKLLGIRASTQSSSGKQNISDFFLDIIPSETYDDTRVAEVNYYRSNLIAPTDEIAATAIPPCPKEADISPRTRINAGQSPSDPQSARPEQSPPRFEPLHNRSEAIKPPRDTVPPVLEAAAFYDTVKPQLDKLFARNEHYAALERLLPDSRWVRVDYDVKGKFYLVGLIGEPVRYICYGVPGKYSPRPPAELAGYCQWLAVDETNPLGDGFWIMYQDGATGKSVL